MRTARDIDRRALVGWPWKDYGVMVWMYGNYVAPLYYRALYRLLRMVGL
jgi:hypothetical protein